MTMPGSSPASCGCSTAPIAKRWGTRVRHVLGRFDRQRLVADIAQLYRRLLEENWQTCALVPSCSSSPSRSRRRRLHRPSAAGLGVSWTDQVGYQRLGEVLAATGKFTRYPDASVFVPK